MSTVVVVKGISVNLSTKSQNVLYRVITEVTVPVPIFRLLKKLQVQASTIHYITFNKDPYLSFTIKFA